MFGFIAVLMMIAALPFIIYENMKEYFSSRETCCSGHEIGRMTYARRRFTKSKPAKHKNTTNK